MHIREYYDCTISGEELVHMCGICGIVNLKSANPIERGLLQRMNDIIEHRGPDDEGFFVGQNIGLAMRRLSIIDLAGGHQPIFNEDQTICVILNGEIYNYLELKQTLEQLGHQFATRSDTETIVHAYEEWGDECASRLRGMFAFAVWDKKQERLFIARDRLGKKPVYYYTDGKRLFFGSEIKALLENEATPRRLNFRALDAYLTLGYVPAPDTMFEGIHKLPAGHVMSVSHGHYEIREYWDLEYDQSQPRTLPEYREQLKALLEESVRIRLMSDVPLGAFLSGGIDSSLVVALMSRYMNQPVKTYSVGFAQRELNELPYARMTAERLGTNHHEIPVDTCTPELVEKLVWHLDEPVADPAAVPTYLVSQLARETVTVVLTGEGGDELFAGYDYYRANPFPQLRWTLPEGVNQRALPMLARGINSVLGRQRYHERTIWYMSMPPGAQMAAWVAIFTDEARERLYTPPAHFRAAANRAKEAFTHFYTRYEGLDELHRLMYIDTKVWLADDLLMKVDKMSMATSLEARCPFLDHRLMEFVATIPSNLKLNGGTSKYILKEIAAEILPEAIIRRPKHTFDVPIGTWIKGSLRDLTQNIISEGVIPGEKLFSEDYICGRMWSDLETNTPGVARQFWSLLNLGLWARKYRVQLA